MYTNACIHTETYTQTQRDSLEAENPALLPQSLAPDFLHVSKPLSLTQEHPRCGGKRGAPGSRGLVKGIGPCPVVCSLAAVCCVCNAGPFGMLWVADSTPSLPHFRLLVHSTPLLLSSPPGPQTVPQHVLGRGSHVFSLYLCFGTEWSVSASGSPRDLTFCSPLALQPSRLPEETHACSCLMSGWTLLKFPDNPISDAQGSS